MDASSGKRRGRKPIRPHLQGRKTEDLDKFWLRKFKAYAKKDPAQVVENTKDREFWNWFFSKSSDPSVSNHMFKSFSRKYKQFLLKNTEFVEQFRLWYENKGRNEAFSRFNEPLAQQYCDYVENELFKMMDPKPEVIKPTGPENFLADF